MSSLTTDRDLLRAYARRGDADAFAHLVEAYQDMVWSVCRRQLGSGGDAEAATQETFLKLATGARTIRGGVGGWLHRCALNVCRDQQRQDAARERRERAHVERSGEGPDWPAIEAVLDAALAELSENDRELIVQHYLVGRSQKDLALAAGVAPQVVHRQVHRAVDHLRTAMQRKDITLPAAVLAATLAGSAKASAAPVTLTASLTKIGLSGAGVGTGLAAATGAKLAAGLTLAAAVTGGAILVANAPGGAATPVPPPSASAVTATQHASAWTDIGFPDPDAVHAVPGIAIPEVREVIANDRGEILIRTNQVDNPRIGDELFLEAIDNRGNRYSRFYSSSGRDRRTGEWSAYHYYLPVEPVRPGDGDHQLEVLYTGWSHHVLEDVNIGFEAILSRQDVRVPPPSVAEIPSGWPGDGLAFFRRQALRMHTWNGASPLEWLPRVDAMLAGDPADRYLLAWKISLLQEVGAEEAAMALIEEHFVPGPGEQRTMDNPLLDYVRARWRAGNVAEVERIVRGGAQLHEQRIATAGNQGERQSAERAWELAYERDWLRALEVHRRLAQVDWQPKRIERSSDGRALLVELPIPAAQVDGLAKAWPRLHLPAHQPWEVAGHVVLNEQGGPPRGILVLLDGTRDAVQLDLTVWSSLAANERGQSSSIEVPATVRLNLPGPGALAREALLDRAVEQALGGAEEHQARRRADLLEVFGRPAEALALVQPQLAEAEPLSRKRLLEQMVRLYAATGRWGEAESTLRELVTQVDDPASAWQVRFGGAALLDALLAAGDAERAWRVAHATGNLALQAQVITTWIDRGDLARASAELDAINDTRPDIDALSGRKSARIVEGGVASFTDRRHVARLWLPIDRAMWRLERAQTEIVRADHR